MPSKIPRTFLLLASIASGLARAEAAPPRSAGGVAQCQVEASPPGVIEEAWMVDVQVESQYHFYVPAYAAKKLAANPKVPRKLAAAMPFLMNTAYEAFKQQSGPDKGSWPLIALGYIGTEPAPQSREVRGDGYFEDSYLGYAGARWGAGLEAGSLSRDRFEEALSKDPAWLLRDALAR